jgi:hypothetical protein
MCATTFARAGTCGECTAATVRNAPQAATIWQDEFVQPAILVSFMLSMPRQCRMQASPRLSATYLIRSGSTIGDQGGGVIGNHLPV